VDLIPYLEKAAPATLTALGSTALTLWRWGVAAAKRVETIESDIKTIKEKLKKAEQDLSTARQEASALRVLVKARATQRDMNSVQNRLTALEGKVAQMEESSVELSKSLQSYIQEQQEEWNAIHRTLGQIEGYMKAQRKESGNFPPPIIKKTL
jgi:predicted  nucleic acid-binding Zn-ribbon protein